ncbi:trimeric intracellular cation channel family protein [Herbaspirillum sp. GCM10030257]
MCGDFYMQGFNTLIQVVEVLGLLAFAFSGFIEARRKDMDLVGVFTVAFITAFGGGTLRDLLLDRRPLFWVEHQEYTLLVFILALVITPFMRHLRSAFSEKLLVTADAFGLGLFSVLGASLAVRTGMPPFVCVMMGVITGIFGGVLRDVICNEIPMVFRRGQLYATCSFLGCWVYLLLDWLSFPETLSLATGILVTVATRMAAVRFDLKLPG